MLFNFVFLFITLKGYGLVERQSSFMCQKLKFDENQRELFSLSVLLISGLSLADLSADGPVVQIPQGLVQGFYKTSYRNRTFSAFEGIPYATPPTGDLRFKEPKPATEWNGTLKANKHYECLHFMPFPLAYGPRGQEDCLYVYIYVSRQTINPHELLDVVVHIHGGGFMLGSPKYMAGPDFIMDRDVVFVSLNYRLGILGFLSTEDGVVPGNNGLKDQSLALEWIKDNIQYFGGNPASITITGLSAGGASVHLHYFSPLSKGLFHKGFSQSGTALLCWALAENSLDKAKSVAKNLTCPTATTKEMIDCLRKVEGRNLLNAIKVLFVYMDAVPFSLFGPVVEKHSETPFLSEQPYKMLQDGNIYDVPWVASNTKDEGLFAVGLFVAYKKLPEIEEKWYDIMLYALELHYTVESSFQKIVLSKIKEYYFNENPISMENIFSLVDLFSDRLFLVDTEKAIRMHAQGTKSKVYYYLFSYLMDMPHFPPGIPKGAAHGDDGRLLFKMFMTPRKLTEKDEMMMEFLLDFITTFAQKGVPIVNSVEWLPLQTGDPNINVLKIEDVDSISMKSVDGLAPNNFWDSLPIQEGENAIAGSSSKIE